MELESSQTSSRQDVEIGRQRRSRGFVVLTYCEYAPRVKVPAALLDDQFEHPVEMVLESREA